jgi:hypothetical protein
MKERDFQMYLNFEQHRVKDRFFNQLDEETVQGLSAAQKKDIMRALVRAFLYPSARIVDIRWVFTLFQNKFFLVYMFGREVRDGEPRYFSRFLSRSKWVPNTLFMLLVGWILFCSVFGMVDVFRWIFS